LWVKSLNPLPVQENGGVGSLAAVTPSAATTISFSSPITVVGGVAFAPFAKTWDSTFTCTATGTVTSINAGLYGSFDNATWVTINPALITQLPGAFQQINTPYFQYYQLRISTLVLGTATSISVVISGAEH
jgi:hypothetical protein